MATCTGSATEVSVTKQVSLFSQPYPSPSLSLSDLTQDGRAIGVTAGTTGAEPSVTRHVAWFSQPYPSPSLSLPALTHGGCRSATGGVPLCVSAGGVGELIVKLAQYHSPSNGSQSTRSRVHWLA